MQQLRHLIPWRRRAGKFYHATRSVFSVMNQTDIFVFRAVPDSHTEDKNRKNSLLGWLAIITASLWHATTARAIRLIA